MRDVVKVRIERGGSMPIRATSGSAGYDLAAADHVTVLPKECAKISTGISIALPTDYVGLVFERSSLHKRGLSLVNKVGVIDSDYRGTIYLKLENVSDAAIDISAGDRLAQLVIVPIKPVIMLEVDSLDETKRGCGGFGSTGM